MRRALGIGALLLAACAGSAPAAPSAQRPAPGPGGPPPRIPFAELDANRDEQIDGEEFALIARRLFARLDANGDGNLSSEEYARFAARPARRGMRGGRAPGGGGPPAGPY